MSSSAVEPQSPPAGGEDGASVRDDLSPPPFSPTTPPSTAGGSSRPGTSQTRPGSGAGGAGGFRELARPDPETQRVLYLTEKNAKARGIRYDVAAKELSDKLTHELRRRNPVVVAMPPGAQADQTRRYATTEQELADIPSVWDDMGNAADTLHLRAAALKASPSALDLLGEGPAVDEVTRGEKERIRIEGRTESDDGGEDERYKDVLRNPNPAGSLSASQMRRRWKLSAKVAWAAGAELVDVEAEALQRAINAYNFEECIRLIHERAQKIARQRLPGGLRAGEEVILPSLTTVSTHTGETALTKACGERGAGAAVEVRVTKPTTCSKFCMPDGARAHNHTASAHAHAHH